MAQSPVPFEVDEKNNPISVSLFESYLGKFVLEHPDLYKHCYIQLLTELEGFIASLPEQRRVDREIHMLFSIVQERYHGYTSFAALKNEDSFNLSATDYFIKHVSDYFVTRNINPPKNSNKELKSPKSTIPAHVQLSFYSINEGRGSPTNSHRDQRIFHENNRGVKVRAGSPVIEPCPNLGIVPKEHCPPEFINYFAIPNEKALEMYEPNEVSYFAKNLRRYWCPVISGASGSTEALFTRIFSITSLSKEQQQLLIFVQACNMVANGHHSLFEAMFVAHTLGFEIEPKETVKEFYLQCVPQVFKEDDAFKALMESDKILALELDTNYAEAAYELDEYPELALLRASSPACSSSPSTP